MLFFSKQVGFGCLSVGEERVVWLLYYHSVTDAFGAWGSHFSSW